MNVTRDYPGIETRPPRLPHVNQASVLRRDQSSNPEPLTHITQQDEKSLDVGSNSIRQIQWQRI